INIAGKDLIVEGGTGSIGRSNCPVTTNMSGAVTARCDDLINLYQIGGYAITFAAAYSGADINICSLGSIFSVYNGVQADELGYINAKGNITLLSDNGDIGQANGKGLRVKITDDKELTAEGNSVYIKGYGENTFNLGKITARTGDIGIDSKTLDVILKNDISSQNLEFKVRSLTQKKGKLIVNKLLNVNSDNGIDLGNFENLISEANLINNKSGNIFLKNNHDLTLYDLINKAENSDINIINEGFVTVKNGFSSNGDLFILADGNIDIQNDSAATKWIGLYSDNGGIKVRSLNGGSIELSGKTNGISADNITSDTYIKANIDSGDIDTGDLKAKDGNLTLVTNDGSISSKNIEGKKDVNVVAFNGKLEVDSIKSFDGDLEAVGYISLAAKSIIAQNNFFVGSLGDVVINKLSAGAGFNSHISDLFDDFNQDEFTSNLVGNNIKIDDIYVLNDLEAVANDNFNVYKIKIGKNANISAEKNIDINNIKSGESLEITSFGDGNINIKDIFTDKGELSISNEIGNIEIDNINAGNDIQLNIGDKGDISVVKIETSNEGSLYANVNNGLFCIESGNIEGEASIYSEEGKIVLTEINVGKELDVRANDGSIVVGYKTIIGGDATLKSNTKSVLLTDAEVGGNMNISAYSSAYINNAKVYGSMLMKGVVDGCTAAILEVGNDLILNTDTGSIKVVDANVGNNSYITIDGKGKDIEISNINTGNVSTGDLIIVSNSDLEDKHTISIENAIAANKLIINSVCNIILNSAFANNGKLEVKAGGNIFAELIKSAKETYISTLFGILEITKVISGDTLHIAAFGGNTIIKDIETLNPEADIIIDQILGNINISNASSSRNLEFTTFYGGINIDTVSTAKDIKIDGFSTEININNSYAGNDINITNENGKIDINNTQIGNNLNVSFAGDMKVKDVQVGNKSSITIIDNSILNIDKFKSSSLDIVDKGKSILNIADSNIDKAEIKLGSNAKIADSTINSINA
ncbi:MAG: DUF4097 family beta strand repeat protein, partial [Candidatus Riflebacteria bacterium]|nr:DUF4097 family beta strand repeat protein [Candidatus Riflebacteria bacterium]